MSAVVDARTWPGRDLGPAPAGLTGLHVWLTPQGPVGTTLADGQRLVVASTDDRPDTAGAPAGSLSRPAGPHDLAGLVPAGWGLLVDGGTPGRRVVPATAVDRLRRQEAPHGDEVGLRTDAVPAHLREARDAAVLAARRAGARAGVGVWATGGGRAGLWISLHRPTAQAVEAAYDAVAARAPAEAVRVLDRASLSREAQDRLVRGLGKERPVAGEVLTGRQSALVALVCLLGAVLVVLGRDRGSVPLEALGWTVEAVLVAGVLVAARGRGARWGPLPFAGSLAVSGLLLWQAARGLS